jgi:hypothetical protein
MPTEEKPTGWSEKTQTVTLTQTTPTQLVFTAAGWIEKGADDEARAELALVPKAGGPAQLISRSVMTGSGQQTALLGAIVFLDTPNQYDLEARFRSSRPLPSNFTALRAEQREDDALDPFKYELVNQGKDLSTFVAFRQARGIRVKVLYRPNISSGGNANMVVYADQFPSGGQIATHAYGPVTAGDLGGVFP